MSQLRQLVKSYQITPDLVEKIDTVGINLIELNDRLGAVENNLHQPQTIPAEDGSEPTNDELRDSVAKLHSQFVALEHNVITTVVVCAISTTAVLVVYSLFR